MASIQPAAIVVLIGLPAAGKSTFAKLLSDKLNGNEYKDIKTVLVTYDELIPLENQKKYAENHSEKEWKIQRQSISKNVDKMLSGEEVQCFKIPKIDRNMDKIVFIIDDNNYYGSMRYEYFQIARKYEVGFCQFHLDITVDEAKKNNQSRSENQRIPDNVIDSMASKLEIPLPTKNNWEKFSIQIFAQNFENSLDLCINMILMTLSNPVQPIEDITENKVESRAKCNASVIHQADKLLRKTVNSKIKQFQKNEMSKDDLKVKAKELNAIKDEVLEDLKSGFTKMPEDVVIAVTDGKKDGVFKLESVVQELFELKIK